MSPEIHELVRRLFDEALERPEAERIPFLETACAGNAEVFNQAKELLGAYAEAGDFLQHPPGQPHHIGRYLIRRELGRGSMGIVYEALDPLIGRTVAIKIIQLNPTAGDADAAFLRDRLFREARSAGMLFHTGIAVILDVGEEGDLAFIAMERIDGPSLYQTLETNRKMEWAKAVSILQQTAAALDFAHVKGVVHRDIKPANIMLEKGVTVKVADFGIAKITSAQQHTKTGLIMGTPCYMSPEQVEARPLDGQSDQFSLAVVAYELLTGAKPFQADTVTALAHTIVYGPRPSAHATNPELPAAVDYVFYRAMARIPAERYGCCSEFVIDLEEALVGKVVRREVLRPPTRRRYVIGSAAVVLALILAALAYHFWPAPVITHFTAEPSSIESGAAATLRWATSGASRLVILPDIGKVAARDSLVVRPTKTTPYVLNASNAAGTASAQTSVEVHPATRPDPSKLCDEAEAKRRAGKFSEALALFRQAAELGERRAMAELAKFYFEDVHGTPRDSQQALHWFRRAADAGDVSAMLHLGGFYELGIGVPEDDQLAASWYRKAADRGSPDALFDLGKMYESGRGVSKDLVQARDLYGRAARLGNAEAKARLTRLPALR